MLATEQRIKPPAEMVMISNFMRFGRVLRDRIDLFEVDAGKSYSRLDEIEIVSLGNLLDTNKLTHMVFPAVRNRLQSLSYFDRVQFRQLKMLMTSLDLSHVYLLSVDDDAWRDIPKDLQTESSRRTFLGILDELSTASGRQMSMRHIKLPGQFKKLNWCSELLRLDFEAKALN